MTWFRTWWAGVRISRLKIWPNSAFCLLQMIGCNISGIHHMIAPLYSKHLLLTWLQPAHVTCKKCLCFRPIVECRLGIAVIWCITVFAATNIIAWSAVKLQQPRVLLVYSRHRQSHVLRSSTSDLMSIQSSLTNIAARRFSCCAPTIWNSLPSFVCTADSFTSFRSQLKTYMFARHL